MELPDREGMSGDQALIILNACNAGRSQGVGGIAAHVRRLLHTASLAEAFDGELPANVLYFLGHGNANHGWVRRAEEETRRHQLQTVADILSIDWSPTEASPGDNAPELDKLPAYLEQLLPEWVQSQAAVTHLAVLPASSATSPPVRQIAFASGAGAACPDDGQPASLRPSRRAIDRLTGRLAGLARGEARHWRRLLRDVLLRSFAGIGRYIRDRAGEIPRYGPALVPLSSALTPTAPPALAA